MQPRKNEQGVKKSRPSGNWTQSVDAVNLSGTAVAFERFRPGRGYRHLLRRTDLERFIALLPDWDELAVGLRWVWLVEGMRDKDGWHRPGTIAIRAWPRDLWVIADPDFVGEHRDLLVRLGVETHERGQEIQLCFAEESARAYQLLHVFLHELGHHHDRMTTRSRRGTARGETYAETYANRYAERIWDAYEAEFGL